MSNTIQTILKEVVDKVVHDNTRKRKPCDLPKLRIKKPKLSWDIKREPIGNGFHLVMSGPNHCGSPVCQIEDPPALRPLSKSLTSPRDRSQMQSPFTPVTLTPHSPPPLSLTPPALPHSLTGIVPKAEFDEWHCEKTLYNGMKCSRWIRPGIYADDVISFWDDGTITRTITTFID